MPWREISSMDERLRFVAAVLAGEQSMTELCASFGISRKTGYKWRARCARQGPEGLHDLSRALIFLSTPLMGELVGVKETDTGDIELYFGPLPLAIIDRTTFKLKRSSPSWRGGLPSSTSSPSESEIVLPMLPD
jgi:hypothetical protein